MKKRLFVVIFLLLITAGTVIVLLSDPWSTVDEGFGGILLESPEKVDKIEVIGPLDTLSILKRGDEWHLNGEEKLNSLPVESLLYTTSKFRVLSILTTEEATAQQEFVKLRFYEGKKLLSTFRFMEIRGKNIVYRAGGANAYMVALPGYDDVTVKKVYTADPDHFRDHLLVRMLPDEIAEIEITPLHGSAFSVSQDSSSIFVIKDIERQIVTVSERKIRLLLSCFSAIRFEAYLLPDQIPVDFDSSAPSSRIVISDFEGISHELKIYTWMKTGEDEPDLFNALVRFDQDPQLMLVNYAYLDLLIRGLETYIPAQ
jgi:hypothetical protein